MSSWPVSDLSSHLLSRSGLAANTVAYKINVFKNGVQSAAPDLFTLENPLTKG